MTISTPLAQGAVLGFDAHAAVDDGTAQAQVFPVGPDALGDLGCQLPGGSEDQGADLFAPGGTGIGAEALEHGKGKAGGLAGAGLGGGEDVASLQGGGDRLGLDGGGLGVAFVLYCAEDRGVEPQLVECNHKVGFLERQSSRHGRSGTFPVGVRSCGAG